MSINSTEYLLGQAPMFDAYVWVSMQGASCLPNNSFGNGLWNMMEISGVPLPSTCPRFKVLDTSNFKSSLHEL